VTRARVLSTCAVEAGVGASLILAAPTGCMPRRDSPRVDATSATSVKSVTSTSTPPERAPPECRYTARVVRPAAVLDVTVRCTGSTTTGFVGDPHLAPFTTDVRGPKGEALPHEGARWTVSQSDDVEIRYRVDLDAAAHALSEVDTAFARGGSIVAPLSSYALVPDPPRAGSAMVSVRPAPGSSFVTELARVEGGYSIALSDIPDSTYGVFGRFEHDVAEIRGVHGPSRIDVVSLDGAFTLTRAERKNWVARAAQAVDAFYGGFPATRAGVVLDPVPGRDRVVFGKVLSGGGSTVALFVGAHTPPAALDSDWVLVHELFHLGFPSIRGAGKWLDEGLATYAEPLIRARAGMLTEEQGWAEVIRDMPLGVELCQTRGLEHFQGDIRSVYWGGAVVALLADVAARRRGPEQPGLEHALRAMVAKGWDSRRAVARDDAIRMVDQELGAPILAVLATAYADHGSPVPLDTTLADLGIERTGTSVRLHDDAKLASMRRAIMYGDASPPSPAHPPSLDVSP